jgi:putative membrane protein
VSRARDLVRVAIIGLMMGAAEVVPGVSGGTIAFISGIYEKLVNSIRKFNPLMVLQLRKVGVKAVWQDVDAGFLLVLFGGMGVSILLFASGISFMLHNEPVAIWSFFFGLVIASSMVVSREITAFGLDIGLAVGVGIGFGVVITQLVPINLEPNPLMLFIGGSVAVCAWILPGLSGSFILLILGLYGFVIESIKTLDIVNLALVGAGCIVGLVSFSQVLARLFLHYKNETLAVLTGFMLGSLGKLWPWKNTTSYQIQPDGSQIALVQEPIMPGVYSNLTGEPADIGLAVACAIAGGVLVLLLDWVGRKSDSRST